MSHTAPTTDQVTATMGEGTANPEPFADRLHVLAQEIREGGPQALVGILKRNQVLSITGASTLALFIAGLGPQVHSTNHIGLLSYNLATVQTHPLVPGWVYVLLALGAAVGLLQYVRTSILEWLMVTRLTAGLSSLAVIVALLQNTFNSSIGLHGAGWGFVLAFLATFVLTFMTRVLYSRAKRAAHAA